MDILYLSAYFVDIRNELASNVEWLDYFVCLSENNVYLYLSILYPILRISGAFVTLDYFWRENALHNVVTTDEVDEINSKTVKISTLL
jgi:hypothetical protein